jgi:hypothetical protein
VYDYTIPYSPYIPHTIPTHHTHTPYPHTISTHHTHHTRASSSSPSWPQCGSSRYSLLIVQPIYSPLTYSVRVFKWQYRESIINAVTAGTVHHTLYTILIHHQRRHRRYSRYSTPYTTHHTLHTTLTHHQRRHCRYSTPYTVHHTHTSSTPSPQVQYIIHCTPYSCIINAVTAGTVHHTLYTPLIHH